MPELRFDQTTAQWVIFSPSRLRRPHQLVQETGASKGGSRIVETCPFCPGNEKMTPPEILAVPSHDTSASSWQVRVVPNKFPALRTEEQPIRHRINPHFQSMGGCGAHEVLIDSPFHDMHFANQPVQQIETVLRTAQRRYQDLMRDRRFQTVIIFKNHGEAAGTSLEHPHWQLIATPVVPRPLRLRHAEAIAFFDRTGECLYCALGSAERGAKLRVIGENEDYFAFVPYAAHLPFETWIFPKLHQASFDRVAPGLLLPLAQLLKSVLLRIVAGLGDPAFNMTIDTVPRGDEEKPYFLWHLRILPRLATAAGFELGSGMPISTVLPEEAAAFLRDIEAETSE